MKLKVKNQKEFLKAALNEVPSDLVIANAKIVNVFTGEILEGNVFVSQGFICHVEYEDLSELSAKTVYDAQGKYLIPGLIDAHVHIESSMMTPRHFCEAVLPWGTTTVVTDPHEIGNVYGIEGIQYMHDISDDLPMRQFIDIPSCVPSVPGLENAGADLQAKEIESLCQLERVVGLAEVMDYLAVIHGEDRMHNIIQTAEKYGLYLQGHSPMLSGRMLSAYLCGGPRTCHETANGKEALEKYRNGMNIDMRKDSMSNNVPELWNGIKHARYYDTLCICTDDRESEDLLTIGHVNDVMNSAIENGMNPIDAIKSATINTAREIHVENLGAIAPGYVADFVVLSSLENITPEAVFFEGKQVTEGKKLLVEIPERTHPLEQRNSILLRELTEEDFKIKAPVSSGEIKADIIEYHDLYSSLTNLKEETLQVEEGYVTLKEDPDLKYVAVLNRYGKDLIAKHVIRGFGIHSGALASTVSHDSHNIVIVYDTPEDALVAVAELKKSHGGMTAVLNQQVLHTLALPIAGLLSPLNVHELSKEAAKMKEADRQLGLTMLENPLLRIVTLALPVVPHVKMSDLGLVDVEKKVLIPLLKHIG